MANFAPSDWWKAIILYGRNQATYKIVLGKVLLEATREGSRTELNWGDLSTRFFDEFLARLAANPMPQQLTPGRITTMERICLAHQTGGLSRDNAILKVGRVEFRVDLGGRRPAPKPAPGAKAERQRQDRAARKARNLALAFHIDSLVRSGEVSDLAAVARMCGVSRARVSKLMGMLWKCGVMSVPGDGCIGMEATEYPRPKSASIHVKGPLADGQTRLASSIGFSTEVYSFFSKR